MRRAEFDLDLDPICSPTEIRLTALMRYEPFIASSYFFSIGTVRLSYKGLFRSSTSSPMSFSVLVCTNFTLVCTDQLVHKVDHHASLQFDSTVSYPIGYEAVGLRDV